MDHEPQRSIVSNFVRFSTVLLMTVLLDAFTDVPLAAAENDELYNLYKAALEWRLAAPIVIRSADDIVSADRWRDRVQPFHHQVRNLITFCRLAPAVLIADEVGLGKTISAGLILSELVARRRVGRALVVCPRVLCDQWVRELADKFRISATAVTGPHLLSASAGNPPVVVTTYETAARYFSHDDMPTDSFQMLILDEAHRLRNLHGPNGPPRVASEIRDVIEERRFTYLLMLTATPVQNRFTDIYSLIDLLTLAKGHRNPFGSFKEFRSTYLQPRCDGRRLRPHMADQFRQILNGYVARTRRVDAELPFPERDVNTVRVEMTDAEREFERIVGQIVGDLNALSQSSLGQALMSSPAALAAQLENMAEGRPRLVKAAASARCLANEIRLPAKLDRLFAICDELRSARDDWRVVVFTRRRETQEMIQRGLTARDITVGLIAGGRAQENQRDTLAFMHDPPEVHVLVSTDAGAEGVNLQEANVLVNYDLPWNPMVLEQRIGRIQRLGSRHHSVHVLNLVAAKTVEEAVVVRLLERLMTVTDTVGDLESILAGVDNGSEDGSAKRFETVVCDLVVRSLRGQNIDRASQQRAASIDRARAEYEANYGQMNRDLGVLDATATASLSPPVFDRPPPSLSAADFVCRALAAEGRPLQEVSPGLFEDAQPRGRLTRLALSPETAERAANNGPVTLFVPGLPAFERLVERWANRRSHRVVDLRDGTLAAAEQVAQAWCALYPEISYVSCVIRSRKAFIHGRVLVRTSAENRVDQHQQLIEHSVTPTGHRLIPHDVSSTGPVLRQSVSLNDVAPRAALLVRSAVAEDEEVNRFSTYYTSRRINELSRAGANPHLRQRVDDDFSVTVAAEVVGFRGACYEEALIDVSFTVAEHAYTATLQAVPLSQHIIERPTDEHCPVSGLRMPYGVLARCDRSGRLHPRHLLQESQVSGRHAVHEYTVVCEVTGKLALDDEVETCIVSGRRAISSQFVTCARTGVRILQSESATSDLSGVTVRKDLLRKSDRPPQRQGLPDEFVRCEITNRSLLKDEAGVSAISNRVADLELLRASERSGRFGLDTEVARCQLTDRLLLEDELDVCAVTGQRVDDRLLSRSQVSRRLVLKELLFRCAVTGRRALSEELETCSLTGELALPDELEACTITGQRIIRGKMVQCALTQDRLSPAVAVASDVSGRFVRPDLIQRSERPPHRAGLPDEIAVCEVSGRRLLLDELARSVVSLRLIDRDLLVGTGMRLAHPSELVRCAVSGRDFLPDETDFCDLTQQRVARDLLVSSEVSGRSVLATHTLRCAVTNRLAARDELEQCALTAEWAVPDELESCAITGQRIIRRKMVRCSLTSQWLSPAIAVASDVSGQFACPDLIQRSERPPHRAGLPDEIAVCEISGRRLLLDELDRSVVSQRLIDRELLVGTGTRLALPSELVRCAVSGRDLLPDETAVCELTQQRVGRDLLVRSEVSQRLVLVTHTQRCPVTNVLAAHDEFEECSITGALVLTSELETCAETGVRALRGKLVRCADTGEWLVPDAAGRSDYSPRWVAKRLLRQSQKPPGRWGTVEEFGVCAVSKKVLLLDELDCSAVSQRLIDRQLLIPTTKRRRLALPEELVRCEESGDWCLPDETRVCESTGLRVSHDLLERSPSSHRLCLKRLFVSCAVSHYCVPIDETELCAVTGQRVAKGVLVACAVTGKRVLPSELKKCTETGDLVLPSEIGYSDYRSRPVKKSLLRQSSKPPGRWGTKAEFGVCEVTRKRLLLDELERCSLTHRLVDRDLLLNCSLTGQRVLKSESATCLWLDKPITWNLGDFCELTRLWMAKCYLDKNGMLQPLAEMLDGLSPSGNHARNDLIPVLKAIDPRLFAELRGVHAVASPSGKVLALCAELTEKTWLGARTRHAGCLLQCGPQPQIIGHLVIGSRGKREWQKSRSVNFI